MFDDDAKGLYREPFVCGIPEMLEALTGHIQEPYLGFALYFSDQPFPGSQVKMDLVGPEDGGNWYNITVGETEMKGWLCPALFKYFEAAPASVYAKAEALEHEPRRPRTVHFGNACCVRSNSRKKGSGKFWFRAATPAICSPWPL